MLNKFINNLQFENEFLKFSIEHTKETNDKLYDKIKEYKSENLGLEYSKINNFINMTVDKKFGLKQGTLKKETMNSEQLEFRALVEEKWTELYRSKKVGIKGKVERILII